MYTLVFDGHIFCAGIVDHDRGVAVGGEAIDGAASRIPVFVAANVERDVPA